MSTNDPQNDRFALPPLAGLFGDDPVAVPVAEDEATEAPSGDPLLPPLEPEPFTIDDDPEPEEPASSEPEEAVADEVEPSETEAAPAGIGIAQALEVVEQLSPSEPTTAAPSFAIDPDPEPNVEAADERVFATAASDMGERPTFGIAEREVPAEAAALFENEPLPDELLPHFLLADAATTALDDAPSFALTDRAVEMKPIEKPKPTVARTLAEIPVLLIVAAVIAFLVKSFLAQAYYIPSGSMLPQLQIDDRVVVSKVAYKTHDPRRGDIIVFDDPRTGNATTETTERTGVSKWLRKIGEGVGVIQPSTDEFIKRVIGLPGDTVEAHDGDVYVNGDKLVEPYLPDGVTTSDFAAQKIEPGRLWVMGDNRSGSADSRVFGQIRKSTIVGRAMVKVWPFSHISFL